jgi:hypothetical protein
MEGGNAMAAGAFLSQLGYLCALAFLQGFMDATRTKLAGKVVDANARAIVTFPISSGCRSTSRLRR